MEFEFGKDTKDFFNPRVPNDKWKEKAIGLSDVGGVNGYYHLPQTKDKPAQVVDQKRIGGNSSTQIVYFKEPCSGNRTTKRRDKLINSPRS